MHHRPSKRALFIRRMLTYAVMGIAIVVLVSVMLLFLLGYRLNSDNGLEQGALLQFDTRPTGAVVTVDGKIVTTKTPTKSTVLAGFHAVTMTKTGYEPWSKDVDLSAGTLTWLDYALLIPKNRPVESVETYPSLVGMNPAPNNKTIIIQQKADQPVFQLVDLRAVQVKSTNITLPVTIYTDAAVAGITHQFSLDQWDENGRYVLVKHTYNDKTEWIVLDTQNIDNSKNVTRLMGVDLSQLHFSGTSGNILYGLTGGTIRKLDLAGGTLSRPLVSGVTSYNLYDTGIITYVASSPADMTQQVGIYQDGDDAPTVLQTAKSTDRFHIAATRYFNDDYVAISNGQQVSLLKGTFPRPNQTTSSLDTFDSFTFSESVDTLNFSDAGSYLFAQTGSAFETFGIEHQLTTTASITSTAAITEPLAWLDESNLYADYDGQLTIREFDGQNLHIINTVAPGFDTVLSPNGRFIYSVGKLSNGSFSLQRVKLILE